MKITIEDELLQENGNQNCNPEHYKQHRDDVRSYSIMMFQMITLLLTSLTIMMGWGVKDFVADKYHIAISTAAPKLYSIRESKSLDAKGEVIPKQSYNAVQTELRATSRRFAYLMWRSPTVSIFLCSFAFFLLVWLGMAIVILYMLQRRRYGSHRLESELGLDGDVPILDPVLTVDSLTHFGLLLFTIVALVIGIATVQTFGGVVIYSWTKTQFSTLAFLIAIWLLTVWKLYTVCHLYKHYSEYNNDLAWKRRWPSATKLLNELRTDLNDNKYVVSPSCFKQIDCLSKLCSSAECNSKSKRKKIWKETNSEVPKLVGKLRNQPVWPDIQDRIEEITETLRVKKARKYYK